MKSSVLTTWLSCAVIQLLLIAEATGRYPFPQVWGSDGIYRTASVSKRYTATKRQLSNLDSKSTPSPSVAPEPQQSSGLTDLLPWDIAWTDSDKTSQRSAGDKLSQEIDAAVKANASSFSIKAGTYRISSQISIVNTVNFTLNATRVQLISEGEILHFHLLNNTNFTMEGPITLDAEHFSFTQGVILSSDNVSQLTIQLMDGYEVPVAGGRVMFFDPTGIKLPMYQISVEDVEAVGPGLYNITLPDGFWETYDEARQNAVVPGNLISIELGYLAGGINMISNHGVSMVDVAVHTYSLVYGAGERGLVHLDRLRGVRRPGTSRLMAGGFLAVSLTGGSLTLNNSEISFNFDDLTDVGTGLNFAFNQSSPHEVYIGFSDPPEIGATLKFYDLETLEYRGAANVFAASVVDDSEITDSYQNGLTNLKLLNWNITPMLVTLNQPVNLTGLYSLVDNQYAKAESIIFENCFFHDSLASGMNTKGASLTIMRNNTVSRAGYRGASVGFDPYWSEGGIPANVIIENNTIETTPHNVIDDGQAISTYCDSTAQLLALATGSPINNVTIRNNFILDAPASASRISSEEHVQVAGIGISYAANNLVTGNVIKRPLANVAFTGGDVSEPYAQAAAIILNTVAGQTYVLNNTIVDANLQTTPELLRVVGNNQSIFLANNSLAVSGGGREPIPDEFWNKVEANSSQIVYSQQFSIDNYTADSAALDATFELSQSVSTSSVATFAFRGTRARYYGCLGPMYGLSSVLVDGKNSSTVDTSNTSALPDFVVPDPAVGFCDQMLFDSGELPLGGHALQVVTLGLPGAMSAENQSAVAVSAFDYLKGQSLRPTALAFSPSPSSLSDVMLASVPASDLFNRSGATSTFASQTG